MPNNQEIEMKALIKLTTNYGSSIWVNPFFIASIAPDKNGSALFIATDANPTYVKESPEEIVSLIKSIEE